MKAIFFSLIITMTSTISLAHQSSLQKMQPEKQAQLIQLLNTLDGEALSALLSPEALEWYLNQFQRMDNGDFHSEADMVILEALQAEVDHFKDPNAPQYK